MTATRERKKRKVSPVALERMLKDPAAIAAWSKQQIDEAKKRIARLKGRFYGSAAFVMTDDDDPTPIGPVGGFLGGICCSHAWADFCFEFDQPYPPAANRTPMVHCSSCGASVPFLSTEGATCADCRSVFHHQQFGPSVSGLAFRAAGDLHLRMSEVGELPLAAEDTSALRREIKLAESGKFVPEPA